MTGCGSVLLHMLGRLSSGLRLVLAVHLCLASSCHWYYVGLSPMHALLIGRSVGSEVRCIQRVRALSLHARRLALSSHGIGCISVATRLSSGFGTDSAVTLSLPGQFVRALGCAGRVVRIRLLVASSRVRVNRVALRNCTKSNVCTHVFLYGKLLYYKVLRLVESTVRGCLAVETLMEVYFCPGQCGTVLAIPIVSHIRTGDTSLGNHERHSMEGLP